MNSRQRRKANRAYSVIRDFIIIRLRLKGEVTEEQIEQFKSLTNFLLSRRSPKGSYWCLLSNLSQEIGLASFAKEKFKMEKVNVTS